jgi:hypothetical protein
MQEMNDAQWQAEIAAIESLRFQTVNSTMPPRERRELQVDLADRLQDLAHYYRNLALTQSLKDFVR